MSKLTVNLTYDELEQAIVQYIGRQGVEVLSKKVAINITDHNIYGFTATVLITEPDE